jgi:hypothetical protein
VPQDVPSASPAKDIPPESESPKVDKPLSPFAGKTLPKMLNPPGSEGTNVPIGTASNPASPPAANSSHDVTHQPPRPESFGLRANGGSHPGEGLSVLRPEK